MLPIKIWEWLKCAFPNSNFILVGDWNQLPPVKEQPIDINKEKWDYSYNLNIQHRTTDPYQSILLSAILNGDTEKVKSIIKTRVRTTNIGSKVVSFHKSAVAEWNSHFDKWQAGTTVIFNSATEFKGTDGKEHKRHYKGKTFINNERFLMTKTIQDTDKFIHLHSLLTDADKIATIEEFAIFFETAEAMTSHRLQGQTIKEGNLTVLLRDILSNKNKEMATKMLYVACSRVSKLDQLFFGVVPGDNLDDLELKRLNNVAAGSIDYDNLELLDHLQSLLVSFLLTTFEDGTDSCYESQIIKFTQTRILDQIRGRWSKTITDTGKKERKLLIKEYLKEELKKPIPATNKELAGILGVSKRTIYNLIGEMK
jgi:predicted DNA-binding transcriptional regulator AlpA